MSLHGLSENEVQMLRDQLLITLVKRAGGDVTIPVAELDDTGDVILEMHADQSTRSFNLVIKQKQ